MVDERNPLDAQLDNLALDSDRLRRQVRAMKLALIEHMQAKNEAYRAEIEGLREVYGDQLFATARDDSWEWRK